MDRHDLFELLPQPAWVFDVETLRFLAVSGAAVRAYGYSREEFLAMTIEQIRPPGEISALRAHLHGRENPKRTEWTHRRKDGTVFSVQISAVPVTCQGRAAELVIATDITALVHTNEMLRRSEEHFQRIADHVPAILWSAHPDGRSTWVNRKWLDFRGTTVGDELGLGWFESVHPEDRDRYLDDCQRAFSSRGPLASEFRAKDSRGRWRVLLARGEPYTDPDGVFHGYLGTCIDVTEQMQAREELTRQKELFQTVFDHIPAMVVLFGEDGSITAVNREFERTLGYTEEDGAGNDLVSALYPDPSVAAEVRAFIERADRNWSDFVTRTKDGRDIETSWANVRLSDGRGIGIGQDATERKRLEAQLRQAQKMESVGRLAGGVAHDFNNLLTAILGFSSLAERDIPEGSPARRSLDEVRKAGERAASLTRQLLLFSRKSVVVSESVDLGDVVGDMTGMLRRMIGEDVRLHTRSAPEATVRADRGQIEQVILNLAVNARDAMPTGGDLWLEVECLVEPPPARGEPPPGRVALTVRDNGVGMTKEVRAHIFEPFFTTKPVGEGTGLGLATVYGIVQQGGGSIEVQSAPGQGTTFRILLPHHPREVHARNPEPVANEARGHGTVLLVEDEETVRNLVAAVLGGGGYHVVTAMSGEDALRLAADAAQPIDLVLSDLVMPGPNGREVVEAILEVRPGLHHLYMSGYTDDAIVSRGIQTGDSPFIQKPFLPAALLSKVRQVLEGSGTPRIALSIPAPLPINDPSTGAFFRRDPRGDATS